MTAADTPQLLTDRGHVVPYVADWTGEAAELLRWDAGLGRYAVFTAGRRGDGRPVLGKMNPPRQRECMTRGRCQVCHRPLTPPLLAAVWPGQTVLHGGRVCPLLMEPFACEPCLRLALVVCPGLARRRPSLSVVAVRRHTLVMTMVRPAGPLAKLKNLPAEGVVSYVKAIVEESEPAPGDWTPAAVAATAGGGR